MGLSRYAFSRKIRANRYYGTSRANFKIYKAVKENIIAHEVIFLKQGQRLDHIAYAFYKDSSLWWVIAAASGIGWGLQVPAGTTLKVPTELNEVFNIL